MLICRENLTLVANMKLPGKMIWRQKFERVEQVIELVMKLFLQEGQQHMVYKPGKDAQTFGTNFPNILDSLKKKTESPFPTTTPRTSLKERLDYFNSHVKAIQEVVKERTEELINSNETDPKKWKIAFKNVSAK